MSCEFNLKLAFYQQIEQFSRGKVNNKIVKTIQQMLQFQQQHTLTATTTTHYHHHHHHHHHSIVVVTASTV